MRCIRRPFEEALARSIRTGTRHWKASSCLPGGRGDPAELYTAIPWPLPGVEALLKGRARGAESANVLDRKTSAIPF